MRDRLAVVSIIVSAAVIISLGAIGILTTQTVQRNLDQVVNTTAQELVTLGGIQTAANRLLLEATSATFASAVGGGDAEEAFEEEEEEEYATAVETLQGFVDRFAELEIDSDEQDEVEAIQQASENFIAASEQLLELAESGDNEAIFSLLEGDVEDAEEELEELVAEIITEEEEKLAADTLTAQRSIVIGNIITIVSTIAGLGLLLVILRTLTQQSTERQRTAEQLREQNLALASANADLDKARKQADSANRTKSEFLATMSHELRTPLNAIIGYSQMLLEGIVGDIEPTQKEYIDRIFANGRTLMGQINDVLDIAKIEAGRMDIVKDPFELRPWFDAIVRETQGLADSKNLTFKTLYDERMPTSIVGDRDRLKQVTLNLLSNAVKFTEEGQIDFRVQRRSDNTWSIEVKDTGVGIAPHAQEYIFDEFRQADNSSTRRFGGTGLGLSIVRSLTMMMGGNIQLQSTLREGSTFTVVLPLSAATHESKPKSTKVGGA